MKKLITAALVAGGLLIGGQAMAQRTIAIPTPCGPLAGLTEVLKNKYAEELIMVSRARQGFTIQMWMNEETKTMTVVLVDPEQKEACVLGSGTNAYFKLDREEIQKIPQSDDPRSKQLTKHYV